MTVNAILTIERHAADAQERYASDITDSSIKTAYKLGWTQSTFANVLNQIEIYHGEDALLKILDRACISPVYSSAV